MLIKNKQSVYFLILVNVLSIVLALVEKWDFVFIVFLFWAQSVIIGIFQFLKILNLEKFSTKNFKINGMSVSPSKVVKVFTAFFFLFHYGFFHLGYLIFLVVGFIGGKTEGVISSNSLATINFSFDSTTVASLFVAVLFFFLNHLFSFLKNREEDKKKVKNIGAVMFFPYARIIPMHLMIVFGFFFFNNSFAVVIFLLLKTVADVLMHISEHSRSNSEV